MSCISFADGDGLNESYPVKHSADVPFVVQLDFMRDGKTRVVDT